ncbi:hypothetical protein D3C85_440930 [compost metagenome]
MPNHAASVFKQLQQLASERGWDIGTFKQRGTTFERECAKVKIEPSGISYWVRLHTRTGDEEQMGRFNLDNKSLTANTVHLLARSEALYRKHIQREP